MSKRRSKADIRKELERQIQDYVRDGGEIQHVRQGESGVEDGAAFQPPFSDGRPVQTRTPALDVLATIDARRKQSKQKTKPAPRQKPRKKIIYDDFGEPLREVWVDS
ncbi:hypothetical protein ACQUQP_16625 [Marinobacterium sp. YM272]|uniref:hypothetical protein n=1 Tax=Marinobacterium sp. YM272 TaxID=3421654 RepID=UPI003D7F32DF